MNEIFRFIMMRPPSLEEEPVIPSIELNRDNDLVQELEEAKKSADKPPRKAMIEVANTFLDETELILEHKDKYKAVTLYLNSTDEIQHEELVTFIEGLFNITIAEIIVLPTFQTDEENFSKIYNCLKNSPKSK